MKRVLVADQFSPEGLERIASGGGLEVEYRPDLTPEQLVAAIPGRHGLVVRSRTRVTAGVVAAADCLQAVVRAGIGVDTIDIAACTARGILVMNTPSGNAVTTAEHAIALLLSLVRHVARADRSMKQGKWEKKLFRGVELMGKTFGVLGLGNIGSIVAERARGLSMRVIAHDPFLSDERARALEVEPVALDELLARADIVSVHVPGGPATAGLIGEAQLAMMKPGAFLINCSRGTVVDEQALYRALVSGRLAGAGIDVFSKEPPPPDLPLIHLDSVVCTPHLGASTGEAEEKVSLEAAAQIRAFLIDGEVRNGLNLPSVSAADMNRLRPWLSLSRTIGRAVCQVHAGPIDEITITCHGRLRGLPREPLSLSVVAGVFGELVSQPVNPVNARAIAAARGTRVVEISHWGDGDFAGLLHVGLRHDDRETVIAGTVFDENEPRIVQLDGRRIEIFPGGPVLLVWNDDRPGVIGAVAGELGRRGINIARLQVALDRPGGSALAAYNLDAEPEAEWLASIAAQRHVSRCVLMRL